MLTSLHRETRRPCADTGRDDTMVESTEKQWSNGESKCYDEGDRFMTIGERDTERMGQQFRAIRIRAVD